VFPGSPLMSDEGSPSVYECSGVRVSSEIPLSAPMSPDDAGISAEVTLTLGDSRDQPNQRPSADVVAELSIAGTPFYVFCRVEGGYVGRLPNIADFFITADLRQVVCYPATTGKTELISIVVPGTVTAFLLAMSGRCVLHASAVDLGGRAVAFAGTSGQGKSTMAALFCATGALLVTDDVLPLEFDPPAGPPVQVLCQRAGTEIRLREKTASLADHFDGNVSVRTTVDDRRAVEPVPTRLDRIPLAAIVLPRPDRESPVVASRRLSDGEAGLWLSRCQRIEGWHGRDHLRQQFVDTGHIVSIVPVYEVQVPWGPPFAPDLVPSVLAACAIEEG
jgi:hypothetical protein